MEQFSKEEIAFIGMNKQYIKSICDKKYKDIIECLLVEKDPVKSEVLKLWAKECKEMVLVLDNYGKIVPKKETQHTGI
jgi:hypothetical protein